ncbi:MAG: type II toxin-antitoxin system RelE/ParE family toxin [Bacillota bacterium]|nr:type II toxin-antitoxin system RelE/ParE family toxin [Bacillota bacterium]
MAKYRVDVSEPAENDLRDIVRYISAQLSAPMTALKMMDTIEEAITGLAVMPKKCPPVKNYIFFFSIDEKSKVVDVERILYARRDWHHIL